MEAINTLLEERAKVIRVFINDSRTFKNKEANVVKSVLTITCLERPSNFKKHLSCLSYVLRPTYKEHTVNKDLFYMCSYMWSL